MYDSALVVVHLGKQWDNPKELVADVCLARERGSKRRSFSTNEWGEIYVSADSFRNFVMSICVVVSNPETVEKAQTEGACANYLICFKKRQISTSIDIDTNTDTDTKPSRC